VAPTAVAEPPAEPGDASSGESGRWSLTVASRTTRAHGRRTVSWLMDAAVAEFASYGYHGASMARIAKRAGTAHGTIYLHFADKDDLLYAALVDVQADLQPALMAVPAFLPGEEGLEALHRWLHEVCRRFQAHGAIVQAVVEALNGTEHLEAADLALRDLGRVLAVLADRVRASGSPDLDPPIAAVTIYALIEGANRTLFRGQLLVSLDELALSLAEFIQRSIFGSPAAVA